VKPRQQFTTVSLRSGCGLIGLVGVVGVVVLAATLDERYAS
jgi:hypothetical protein